MLGTLLALGGALFGLVLHSYRAERRRAEAGGGFQPAGKIRWSQARTSR